MKNQTGQNIIDIIAKNGSSTPHQLSLTLGLTPQAVHSQLRKLQAQGKIRKTGKVPHVIYLPATNEIEKTWPEIKDDEKLGLDPFSYLRPNGALSRGLDGFRAWVADKELKRDYQSLCRAYSDSMKSIYAEIDSPIDVTARLESIHPTEFPLQKVWIHDFYALPQFGKTHFGNLIFLAKSSEQLWAVDEISIAIIKEIRRIVTREKIDAVCFMPHSIPRRQPFNPNLRKRLNLELPEVVVLKAFADGVPVAQKSLSKLSQRITNAKETLFTKDASLSFKTVLVIDDAIGSGATLVELARKLKKTGVKKVFGYAVVGSYKGFDVISSV
jgi:hypothetical protein